MRTFLYIYLIMAISPVWVKSTHYFFTTKVTDGKNLHLAVAQISMFIIAVFLTLLVRHIKTKKP